MRLVTWNARRGTFSRKAPLLDSLCADIAVIQEIATPAAESDQTLWFGDKKNSGLAVLARRPYTLRRLPELPNVPKHFIPVAVEGPRTFTLFAVWTLGRTQPMRYVEAASTAIDMYTYMFATGPVVLLGDFNSNAIWNKHHPAALNHGAMVERLRKLGLVSSYHHHRGVEHGAEPRPEHTFHLYGHENKSYHIDYCFMPTPWADEIDEVHVGEYVDWHVHSDHRPLLVTLRDKD
jgi:endonuclease/exonuclease/phosphatase family metal-dependent hydrolase